MKNEKWKMKMKKRKKEKREKGSNSIRSRQRKSEGKGSLGLQTTLFLQEGGKAKKKYKGTNLNSFDNLFFILLWNHWRRRWHWRPARSQNPSCCTMQREWCCWEWRRILEWNSSMEESSTEEEDRDLSIIKLSSATNEKSSNKKSKPAPNRGP